MRSWSSSRCSSATVGRGAALAVLALTTLSGCGSDAAPAGTVATLAPPLPESTPAVQPPTPPESSDVDDVAGGAIASLPPGPDAGDLVSASATDLVIVKPGTGDDLLRAAIAELGGEIHFESEQLGLYGARFGTSSAAELAEVRDELRRRGFDASIDIESEDPTTG